MVKIVLLAAMVAVPVATFHIATGPLHMEVKECLPHILIALMAILVHKMIEIESSQYMAFSDKLGLFTRRVLRSLGRNLSFLCRNMARTLGYVVRLTWQIGRKLFVMASVGIISFLRFFRCLVARLGSRFGAWFQRVQRSVLARLKRAL